MRRRIQVLLSAVLALLGLNANATPAERAVDPLLRVVDIPLTITGDSISKLKALRSSDKFASLPGVDPTAERLRLSAVANELLDRLVAGIQANPTKLWVMQQFQMTLVKVEYEDTEGREHFGQHLWQIMQILGIESSDGLLSAYL